jgi:DNA-binding transcriptional LysR family regulator
VDDKDWLILKTIAEEKNITKAAARLFISQPALTYRLKNIEEEFGTQVVSRVPSGVVFTPQGDLLLNYVSEMLRNYGAVKEQIRNMESKVQGVLRVGSSSVFALHSLPRILRGFLNRYPEVDIALQTGLSNKMIRMLENQEVTLAIVRGDHAWEGERHLLSEEPICLISHDKPEFEALLEKPYIRYRTSDAALEKMTDTWWRKNFSAPPRTSMEVNTIDSARQLVMHGLGWAILPSIGLRRTHRLYHTPLSWPDGEPLVRRTWVLCSNGAMELRTVRAFLGHLESGQMTAEQ